MMTLLLAVLAAARLSLKSRRALALENLALRQQRAVLRRQVKRPKLSRADRAFWIVLALAVGPGAQLARRVAGLPVCGVFRQRECGRVRPRDSSRPSRPAPAARRHPS